MEEITCMISLLMFFSVGASGAIIFRQEIDGIFPTLASYSHHKRQAHVFNPSVQATSFERVIFKENVSILAKSLSGDGQQVADIISSKATSKETTASSNSTADFSGHTTASSNSTADFSGQTTSSSRSTTVSSGKTTASSKSTPISSKQTTASSRSTISSGKPTTSSKPTSISSKQTTASSRSTTVSSGQTSQTDVDEHSTWSSDVAIKTTKPSTIDVKSSFQTTRDSRQTTESVRSSESTSVSSGATGGQTTQRDIDDLPTSAKPGLQREVVATVSIIMLFIGIVSGSAIVYFSRFGKPSCTGRLKN